MRKLCKANSLICVLSMLVCFCSCGNENQPDSGEITSEAPLPDESSLDGKDYLRVERRKASSIARKYFSFYQDFYALALILPSDLKMSSSMKAGFSITREGVEVGSIVSGKTPLGEHQVSLDHLEWKPNGVDIQYYLLEDKATTDINEKYFHQYVFTYSSEPTTRSATLTIKYSEMNDESLKKSILLPVLKKSIMNR